MTELSITFPGNKKVNAHYKGFVIQTDQPKNEGGDGSAPEPFSLFLASIGTCTGIYVLRFCQERNIPTEGLEIYLNFTKNYSSNLIEKINITINPPKNFPPHYKNTLLKVAQLCTVKKHLDNPPEISMTMHDH